MITGVVGDGYGDVVILISVNVCDHDEVIVDVVDADYYVAFV